MVTPTNELATIPALKKQISRIQKVDAVPVILNLPAVSYYRRKSLIEHRIPFVTSKQIYLPFSAMTMSRATKQIEAVRLLLVKKEGGKNCIRVPVQQVGIV